MHRSFALLLLTCLTTAALSACGSDEATAGDATTDTAGGTTDAASNDVAADVGSGADGSEDTGTGTDASVEPDTNVADTDGPDTAPPTYCESTSACDDNRTCTADECIAPGTCQWILLPGSCLIAGACYQAGEPHPTDPCRVCEPSKSAKSWTLAASGTACDDGETCTIEDACSEGTCGGKPLACDDGNPCTTDVCVAGTGCVYPATVGAVPCDDGDACTEGDACSEGKCFGKPQLCVDGNPCTVDSCDAALGCLYTQLDSPGGKVVPCDDGDACTDGDACVGGSCKPGDAANCDDGNLCTKDGCDSFAGCTHLPTQNVCCTGQTSVCDDGDPCTNDNCDPATGGCSKSDNTAICDDGDACTQKDTCDKGTCAGKTATCDDGSPCTSDACDPKKGCVHSPVADGKPCDDGDACSKNDACAAGVCKGQGGCACTPAFSETAAKVTSLQIGKGGKIGEGLDLDGNPKTCAPSSSCEAGIDNALGSIAGLVNGQLTKPVTDGTILLLIEMIDFKQGPMKLAIHQGELAKSNPNCDIQSGGCAYTADPSLLDLQTCKPSAALDGKLVGSTLTAGGKGTVFPLALPLQDGIFLQLTLYDLQLQAKVTVQGKTVTSFDGILAGAVPKAQLLAAIDALPDEGLPLPKASIKTLLDSTVETDVDADGDGKKESSSLALKVTGVSATIVGVTAP